MSVYQNFFRHWDHVHNITVKVMELFPEEKKSFKPAEPMMMAKDLIQHIADVERVFLEGCKKGSIEIEDFKRVQKVDFQNLKNLIDYFEITHKEVNSY